MEEAFTKSYETFCREKAASRMADKALIERGEATPWQIQLQNSIVTKEFCQQAKVNDQRAFRALARSGKLRQLFAK